MESLLCRSRSPLKQRVVIRHLKGLGGKGPVRGARHWMMVFGSHRLPLPRNSEYSVLQLRLLRRELRELGIVA